MRILIFFFALVIFVSCSDTNSEYKRLDFLVTPRILDTLIDAGNHQLHFRIFQGHGVPILFESGAGDDCHIWDTILEPVFKATGATLITYDRAGFGKSTVDSLEKDVSGHGILSGLRDLEIGLEKLGYNGNIMIVSHSYGGYYTTLYASKHEKQVKSVVLLDVNHDFYAHTAEEEMRKHRKETEDWKKKNIAFYYMAINLGQTAGIMNKTVFPKSIPVTDIVDGISFLETNTEKEKWKTCHRKFVAEHPKCKGITAFGCNHYIWFDNPSLVINEVVKSYQKIR